MKRIIFLFLGMSFTLPAAACELAQVQLVFPGMGTHIAWYCKAGAAEKKSALEATRAESCVALKLRAWDKPELASGCTDVIPYYYTRSDALKAGPILDCRITLESNSDDGFEHRVGLRVLATGRKTPTGVRFDLGEASRYTRDCPATGCSEQFSELCEEPGQSLSGY